MVVKFINYLRFKRWYFLGRFKIRKKIKRAAKKGIIKVLLGSADTNYENWISTDLPHFNITKASDWNFFFNKVKINNLLAEHVLEHLIKSDVDIVIRLAYQYLSKGGCFRIAVPDAWHPNPEYVKRESDTSNYYPPPHNHKSFWNIKSLSDLLISAGFTVEYLEYCNAKREIIPSGFDFNNGPINRSISKGFKCEMDNYSSLIIDAKKINIT